MSDMSDTIYTNTARFDTGRPLKETELRTLAPSIFSEEAHHSRSDRFKHISTWDALKALNKEGFDCVGAKQTRLADPSKRGHAKHMLRLRRLNDGKSYTVNDSVFELILTNSNDGSACYELIGGLYRIACMNSLVYHTKTLEHLKVYHKGQDILQKVIEGSFTVLKNSDRILEAPDKWSKVNLDTHAQLVLAEHMHTARFRDANGDVTTPISKETMLITRRDEDKKTDLYTVFNVCQENAMVGGLSGKGEDRNGKDRIFTSKRIKGIDKEVSMNREFWEIGSMMYEALV